MAEGGMDYQGVSVQETSNLELAEQLNDLARRDTERLIHIPVVHRTFDKRTSTNVEETVGNIFADSTQRRFLVLFSERGKPNVLVIAPKGGPEADNQQDIDDFYQYIHYNPEEQRFAMDEQFGYGYGSQTKGGVTSADLSGVFDNKEMLLADGRSTAQKIIKDTMTDALAYGTDRTSSSGGIV